MHLSLTLAPADPLALRARADAREHLDRAALARLLADPEHAALARWLAGHGMRPHAGPGLGPLRVACDEAQLRAALGEPAALALLRGGAGPAALARDCLPRRWSGVVHGVHLERGEPGGRSGVVHDVHRERGESGGRSGVVHGVHRERGESGGRSGVMHDVHRERGESRVVHGVGPGGSSSAVDGVRDDPGAWSRPLALLDGPARDVGAPCGLRPADIRARYRVPAGWCARGETIAVMALGGLPDRRDLAACWAAWGCEAPEVHARGIGGGAPSRHPLHTFETTMSLAWLGAMAPGARLVVYFIDPAHSPDPWATFLQAVIADDELRPTIATTSWSAPESQYYRTHGRETIACLLEQAAALGITVLAATGDWGPLAGPPAALPDGTSACAAAWPHAVFPAVEARVLAVGGTMAAGATEQAYNATLSPTLREALGLERHAGGGGFSEYVPIPGWQRPALGGSFARTDDAAVRPCGRGYPDVALLAGNDAPASSYGVVLGGRWRDDAGGTSLAAPIWAAIVAGINHARREAGRARLGCCAAQLYEVAGAGFTTIVEGDIDVVVPVGDGASMRVAGYRPSRGWDPVTGLGVPRVDELLRALV